MVPSNILAQVPQMPQEQGDTTNQVLALVPVANRLGLYDAADFLDRTFRRPAGGQAIT